jgi:hypothetical protein
MADATVQYVTQGGERWDTVSFNCYGTPYEVERLIDANPVVPISERLPAGVVLEIPVLQDYSVTTDKTLLPPWKR